MEIADRELRQRFITEFKPLALRPFILETTALHAWVIISQAQLALRHPENNGESSKLAREMIQDIINTLCPPGSALREVADRGWQEKYDIIKGVEE